MSIADTYKAKMVQVLSWNDYQSGTMMEPTLERGFDDLIALQKWSGVSYGKSELELIYEYYQKRKIHQNDPTISGQLRAVYNQLSKLNVDEARNQLKSIP
jgi:glycoprotein endo-alpha-1,2-mannosidase